MPTRAIKDQQQLQQAIQALSLIGYPMTLTWTKGANRTKQQNALVHKWFTEIATAIGSDKDSVKAECNLRFGLSILEERFPDVVVSLSQTLKPLNEEGKIDWMNKVEPAVTSRMNVKELTQYMQGMQKHFGEAGIYLTDPELRGWI